MSELRWLFDCLLSQLLNVWIVWCCRFGLGCCGYQSCRGIFWTACQDLGVQVPIQPTCNAKVYFPSRLDRPSLSAYVFLSVVLVVRVDPMQVRMRNVLHITQIILLRCLSPQTYATAKETRAHKHNGVSDWAAFHVKSSSRPGLQPSLPSARELVSTWQ